MADDVVRVRPAAVAGAFYPDSPRALSSWLDAMLAYARGLLVRAGERSLPQGAPKVLIVPHAGYVYSGTTAALAFALLERGKGTVRRVVIAGPTHRVAVRGVAVPSASAFDTPLGRLNVDVAAEARALGLSTGVPASSADAPALRSGMRAAPDAPAPALIVNDPTHAQEHAIEVQLPFVQRVLGNEVEIVPLNVGDASPREVGDVLRAFWGGPETVVIISSDLSHYHPERDARRIDDETIARIVSGDLGCEPDRACGAYAIAGLLDVCRERGLDVCFLGCSTSGDEGEVALSAELAAGDAGATSVVAARPAMADPDASVVGYASFAVWERASCESSESGNLGKSDEADGPSGASGAACQSAAKPADSGVAPGSGLPTDAGSVLINLARTSLRLALGLPPEPDSLSWPAAAATHPWLREPGASFVTLTEDGDLRGCIGSLQAYRELGADVAAHAVDAALNDYRFQPVMPDEYARLSVEVSVLSRPDPLDVSTRTELEAVLRPGADGLIIDDGAGHRATFLPQVWDELPDRTQFVAHLLYKAGLPPSYDWRGGAVRCWRYAVDAFTEE